MSEKKQTSIELGLCEVLDYYFSHREYETIAKYLEDHKKEISPENFEKYNSKLVKCLKKEADETR